MKLYESMNEHGIPVSHFLCNECGIQYTITPGPEDEKHWNVCLAKGCPSYDPGRDADGLFSDAPDLV